MRGKFHVLRANEPWAKWAACVQWYSLMWPYSQTDGTDKYGWLTIFYPWRTQRASRWLAIPACDSKRRVLRFFLSCRLAILNCVVCVKRCELWWQGLWKTFSSVPTLRPWTQSSDSMTPRWKFSGSNLGWSSERRLFPHKFIRNCFIVSVCTLHPYIFRTCKFTRIINSYDKNIF